MRFQAYPNKIVTFIQHKQPVLIQHSRLSIFKQSNKLRKENNPPYLIINLNIINFELFYL